MPCLRRGRIGRSLLIAITACVAPLTAAAQTVSFKDVPANSPYYAAVEYLKGKGILQGYADGTFRPEKKVNRAEAVKIVASPLVTEEERKGITQSAFTDVAASAWFLPYVELARQKLSIIDGPPKATAFHPEDPVLKAQFLKMFFLANKIDTVTQYGEIKYALATDVKNPDEWYFPHLRYALATSMTMVGQEGNLHPAKELTRGEIALLLFRYFMYQDGRRSQALLSEAESEIVNVLKLLELKNVDHATYASARSLLASRGALTSKPDEPLVKGAVKISEGFLNLVLAYKAGREGKLLDVIQLTGDAWHMAEKGREFSPSLDTVTKQMQSIAKNMADEARKVIAESQAQPQ